MPIEYWDKYMAINLTSVFLGTKHGIPVMKQNGGGSIINISSIAGLTGGCGAGPYTASKGGGRLFTKGLAIAYGKANIRVNSIHPGFAETPMTKEYFANEGLHQWFVSSPEGGKGHIGRYSRRAA